MEGNRMMLKGLIIGTDDGRELAGRLGREGRQGQQNGKEDLRLEGEPVWEAWPEQIRDRPSCRISCASALDKQVLGKILESWGYNAQECLCIVETDDAAHAARELGIPCVAYLNPALPEGAFAGIGLLLEGFEEVDWPLLCNAHTRALGLPAVIARTERLVIREMTLEDLDALYPLYEEPSARRFVKGLDPDREAERECTRAYIRFMYGLCQFGMWVLVEKASGAVIGRAGFGLVDYRGRQELDFGYLIGEAWRGQGLALEAGRAVLAYGRDVLGFERVAAFIHPENEASLGVIKRLGFAKTESVAVKGERLLCFERSL